MSLTFLNVPLEHLGIDLGIQLVLVSDGRVIFERTFTFVPTYDYSKDGVTAVFDNEGFSLAPAGQDWDEYQWGVAYPYKEIPTMLAWLKQQNMQLN